MTFLKQISDSLYNPVFYRAVLNQGLGPAFGYYFKLAVSLSLLAAVLAAIFIVPGLNRLVWQLRPSAQEFFPADLVVTIEAGEVFLNQDAPVKLKWPSNWLLRQDIFPSYLLIIDPALKSIPASLKPLDAALIIGSNFVTWPENQNLDMVQTSTFAPDFDLVIDRPKLDRWFGGLEFWYKFIGPAVVLLIFITTLVLTAGLVVPFMVMALFMWILIWSLKNPLELLAVKYHQALSVTLHAATAGLLWFWIALIFGWSGGFFWLPAFTLLAAYINLASLVAERRNM